MSLSSVASYDSLELWAALLAGQADFPDALGLHFHTTIAVQPNGIVRGLLHQSHWSRQPAAAPVAGQRKDKPIEDKESYKWLEGIEAAEAALANLPADQRPRLLHLFDREGDIHEVLERISASPHGAVIRVAQTERHVAGPLGTVADTSAAQPCRGTHTIDVPPKPGQKKRRATLEVRSVSVTITPKASKYPHRQAVTWTLVEAKEIEAPAGVEPLHWLLWTTEPAQTLSQIVALVRLYKLRWLIEDFHVTLKSGCRIEDLRLETADRLIKALLMYSAVALRILALRDLARPQPNQPCTVLVSTTQWQLLYRHILKRSPTPETPVPTIRQVVLWIGRLGGHLGRKGDGMPGVRVLWRGWRDLTVLLAGYLAAHTSP